MKIEQQQHGAVLVLVPHGPLVRDDVEELRGKIRAGVRAHAGRLVLDMEDVPYLDSVGIELLADECTGQAGGDRPRLASLTETCRESLDLTDVLLQLDVFDGVESAIRSCKR